MERVRDLLTREPALIIGFVVAGIAVLSAFGFVITEEQGAAVVAFVWAFIALVGSLLTRESVYSPATHMKELEIEYRAGRAEEREGVEGQYRLHGRPGSQTNRENAPG